MQSRTFDYNVEEKNKVVMIPFGDLFNHRNPPNLLWGYGTNAEGRYGWKYEALNPVKAGD